MCIQTIRDIFPTCRVGFSYAIFIQVNNNCMVIAPHAALTTVPYSLDPLKSVPKEVWACSVLILQHLLCTNLVWEPRDIAGRAELHNLLCNQNLRPETQNSLSLFFLIINPKPGWGWPRYANLSKAAGVWGSRELKADFVVNPSAKEEFRGGLSSFVWKLGGFVSVTPEF